jgi:hypothetical protein
VKRCDTCFYEYGDVLEECPYCAVARIRAPERMACATCGADILAGSAYCSQCAAPLSAAARHAAREALATRGLVAVALGGLSGGMLFGFTGSAIGVLGAIVWVFWDGNRKGLW